VDILDEIIDAISNDSGPVINEPSPIQMESSQADTDPSIEIDCSAEFLPRTPSPHMIPPTPFPSPSSQPVSNDQPGDKHDDDDETDEDDYFIRHPDIAENIRRIANSSFLWRPFPETHKSSKQTPNLDETILIPDSPLSPPAAASISTTAATTTTTTGRDQVPHTSNINQQINVSQIDKKSKQSSDDDDDDDDDGIWYNSNFLNIRRLPPSNRKRPLSPPAAAAAPVTTTAAPTTTIRRDQAPITSNTNEQSNVSKTGKAEADKDDNVTTWCTAIIAENIRRIANSPFLLTMDWLPMPSQEPLNAQARNVVPLPPQLSNPPIAGTSAGAKERALNPTKQKVPIRPPWLASKAPPPKPNSRKRKLRRTHCREPITDMPSSPSTTSTTPITSTSTSTTTSTTTFSRAGATSTNTISAQSNLVTSLIGPPRRQHNGSIGFTLSTRNNPADNSIITIRTLQIGTSRIATISPSTDQSNQNLLVRPFIPPRPRDPSAISTSSSTTISGPVSSTMVPARPRDPNAISTRSSTTISGPVSSTMVRARRRSRVPIPSSTGNNIVPITNFFQRIQRPVYNPPPLVAPNIRPPQQQRLLPPNQSQSSVPLLPRIPVVPRTPRPQPPNPPNTEFRPRFPDNFLAMTLEQRNAIREALRPQQRAWIDDLNNYRAALRQYNRRMRIWLAANPDQQ
jgi:hypothetical protein